jgi:hypothetical protein
MDRAGLARRDGELGAAGGAIFAATCRNVNPVGWLRAASARCGIAVVAPQTYLWLRSSCAFGVRTGIMAHAVRCVRSWVSREERMARSLGVCIQVGLRTGKSELDFYGPYTQVPRLSRMGTSWRGGAARRVAGISGLVLASITCRLDAQAVTSTPLLSRALELRIDPYRESLVNPDCNNSRHVLLWLPPF